MALYVWMQYCWKPEKDAKIPWSWSYGHCESLHVGSENWTMVLYNSRVWTMETPFQTLDGTFLLQHKDVEPKQEIALLTWVSREEPSRLQSS